MKAQSKTPESVIFLTLIVIIALLITSQASAATIEMPMNFEYDNGTGPAGVNPWATATFIDKSPNTVALTMSAANLSGSEFISVWLFNFDPSFIPDFLSFSPVGAPVTGPVTVNSGFDAFKAGPDKYYDIKFDFASSNGKNSDRFIAGESLVYEIKYTGPGILNASSFNFDSSSDNGTFNSAMHVQGINPGDKSVWVSNTTVVPEPISYVLFFIGGAGLAARQSWKKRRSA